MGIRTRDNSRAEARKRVERKQFAEQYRKQSDMDRSRTMERALREILFARPPGPIPKMISGSLIERVENIAREAIQPAQDTPRLMTLHDETMAMLTLDERAIAAVEADMAKRHFVNRMADARAAIGVYLTALKQQT